MLLKVGGFGELPFGEERMLFSNKIYNKPISPIKKPPSNL